MCAYWTDHPYLERIEWVDGTEVFCKKCDAKQPMTAQGKMLVCPSGHETHPAQAVASGELAR